MWYIYFYTESNLWKSYPYQTFVYALYYRIKKTVPKEITNIYWLITNQGIDNWGKNQFFL